MGTVDLQNQKTNQQQQQQQPTNQLISWVTVPCYLFLTLYMYSSSEGKVHTSHLKYLLPELTCFLFILNMSLKVKTKILASVSAFFF